VRLDRFQKLALSTTVATYLLIAVGGLVRAAGAGLGCPDWPRCFDRWIPPTDVSQVPSHIDPALFNFAKAWTEYVNRLVGVTVGFLIFATLVLAWRHHRKSPRVFWPTVASFVLVGVEGWLGGQVVRSGLHSLVLTAHLVLALVIVSLLLYATVTAFFPGGRVDVPLSKERRTLGRAALGVFALTLVQVGIGAFVRGDIQELAKTELARAEWITQLGTIDIVHRQVAALTTLAVLGLVWMVFRHAERDVWLRGFSTASAVLVGGQAAAGLGLAYFAVPPVLQVAHLWLSSLLLGALTVVAMLAYRVDPRWVMGDSRSQVNPSEK
jgi:cytochrome c oxidase assembly protein subunit 15